MEKDNWQEEREFPNYDGKYIKGVNAAQEYIMNEIEDIQADVMPLDRDIIYDRLKNLYLMLDDMLAELNEKANIRR